MRKIIVSGFLAQDAQKQISKQNREYVTFNLANHEYNDEKGADGLPITSWFRVSCFNNNHIALAQHLKKGSNVIVTGTFKDSIYQNRQGAWAISRDLVADSIDFAGGKQNDSQLNSGQPTVGTRPTIPQGAATPTIPKVSSMPTTAPILQATVSKPTSPAIPKVQVPPTNVTAEEAVDDLPF